MFNIERTIKTLYSTLKNLGLIFEEVGAGKDIIGEQLRDPAHNVIIRFTHNQVVIYTKDFSNIETQTALYKSIKYEYQRVKTVNSLIVLVCHTILNYYNELN